MEYDPEEMKERLKEETGRADLRQVRGHIVYKLISGARGYKEETRRKGEEQLKKHKEEQARQEQRSKEEAEERRAMLDSHKV